jgi:hypothetical protein
MTRVDLGVRRAVVMMLPVAEQMADRRIADLALQRGARMGVMYRTRG